MVERIRRHRSRFLRGVAYILHHQLYPAKFSILILIYFCFKNCDISHSHAAFGRYSHVSVHEFYEKEREVRVMEQCGLVAIFHHAESFVMFAYVMAA